MARAVYRPNEVEYVNGKVILESPFPEEKAETDADKGLEDLPAFARYDGPTVDDLRREAENFKTAFAKEKAEMQTAARAQADAILDDARSRAKQIVDDAETQAAAQSQTAETEAAKRLEQAEAAAKASIAEAGRKSEETRKQGYDEGLVKGHEEGFTQGMTEVQRLAARMRTILERIQDKRALIINETEQQIIDLTLLIARKIVKSISASHKDVVIENIREALSKVKTKGTVTIKVNLTDLELSTAHIESFTKMIEGSGTIQILEDTTIDPGGCIVETDFGEIDARIASQFAELESKILEISPIPNREA
ncbi:MAG: flagellar assembly protein FliH [Spirochaetaceae bacterium]|jgi:flagellar assembly protein FliH|nr:flagellar assembly protein FliH [Spirochaetaceae bacterium]